MKSIFLIIILALASTAYSQNLEKEEIRRVLMDQQGSWNSGDLHRFMDGYWHSDSLKFIGKKGVTYGWEKTLQNYQQSFPDRATMGMLQFDLINIEDFGCGTALVTGKWGLHRDPKKGAVGGHFTLLFRKIKGQWKIVTDHTS